MMERPPTEPLVEQLAIEATRFRDAKTLVDRKTYLAVVDRLLDEWNQDQTIEFDPVEPEKT